MKKFVYILPVLLFALIFAGCKKNNPVQPWNDVDWEFISCTAEEKEADFCNMIYQPVCGNDWETYWNSCVACSSQKINSYKMWECDCNEEDWICSVSEEEIQGEVNIEWEINGWEITEQEEIPEIVVEVPVPDF